MTNGKINNPLILSSFLQVDVNEKQKSIGGSHIVEDFIDLIERT